MTDNDIQNNKPVEFEAKFTAGASVATIEESVRACLTDAEQTLRQWHGKSEDFIIGKRDMHFHEDARRGQIALDASTRHGRRMFLPTQHARRQISRMLNSKALLAKGLNRSLRSVDAEKFLCRTITLPNGIASLRGFLSPSFSTGMDNLGLCTAVKKALNRGFISRNFVSALQCRLDSGGDILVDIHFDKHTLTKLKQLEGSKEEYTRGIRLCASEIGRYEYITVEVLLTRMICLNGEIFGEREEKILISYLDAKALGESRVQEGLNELIRSALNDGVASIANVRSDFEKRVETLLDEADRESLEFEDENDIRAALDFIIRRAKLGSVGVTVEDVLPAYHEEAEATPGISSAWLLLNALTRYATHHLIVNNLHSGQVVQREVYERLLGPRRIPWRDIIISVREQRRIRRGVRV
ncbi:MAG: hypothetical protein ACR2P4_01335 [Gammaproteobacteria bacterium]